MEEKPGDCNLSENERVKKKTRLLSEPHAAVGVVRQTSQLAEVVRPRRKLTHFSHSTLMCQDGRPAGRQHPDKGPLSCWPPRLLSRTPLLRSRELPGSSTSVLI